MQCHPCLNRKCGAGQPLRGCLSFARRKTDPPPNPSCHPSKRGTAHQSPLRRAWQCSGVGAIQTSGSKTQVHALSESSAFSGPKVSPEVLTPWYAAPAFLWESKEVGRYQASASFMAKSTCLAAGGPEFHPQYHLYMPCVLQGLCPGVPQPYMSGAHVGHVIQLRHPQEATPSFRKAPPGQIPV